uniref:Uncharacterized protein n=1 Tax=Cyprinus carpio TaxID=7962 RepID=A0A8C2AQF3_CYPCA
MNPVKESLDPVARSFYMGLLAYRSTPLECGYSPAYLLMGQRLRSNLPVSENLLSTRHGEKVKKYKEHQRAKQKSYYNKGTCQLP